MSGHIFRRVQRGPLAAALMLFGGMIAGAVAPASASVNRDVWNYYNIQPAPRSDAMLRQVVMDVHNRERQSLGVPALAWDDRLAADAAGYARQMVHTNQSRHSHGGERDEEIGENLWMGTHRAYGYTAMLDAFMDERRAFVFKARFPDVSTTGNWEDVGHYTQMIWRGTRRVGCALGEGAQYDYLVCRYYPAGNVYGMSPFDRDFGGWQG